jgi:hypothetical protein
MPSPTRTTPYGITAGTKTYCSAAETAYAGAPAEEPNMSVTAVLISQAPSPGDVPLDRFRRASDRCGCRGEGLTRGNPSLKSRGAQLRSAALRDLPTDASTPLLRALGVMMAEVLRRS